MTLRSLCRAGYTLGIATVGLTAPASAQGNAHDREIENLSHRRDVQLAFRVIDELEPTTLADHIMLTQIPAPPFMEEVRAEKFAEMLREAGADSVWIDEVGNVLALRRGRGERTVAIDAHLDTVFPEGTDVSVRISGDTLFAPGIGDDTRGLIVILTVLRAMNAAEIETTSDLLFIGAVGEEGLGDLRGVKHLFRDGGPRIDSWIAVDGGTTGRVVHRGLGSHRYRVTFKGPGGHSWGAFGLGNPQHALGRAIQLFVDAADPYTASGIRTSYNVGRIGGGTSVNSIPFEAWMEVDMRSESPERLDGIDALFRRAMGDALDQANRLRRQGDALTVDVDMIGNRPSGATPEDTPLVQRALAATNHFGVVPNLDIASTDSNIPISLGIPAVTISRGGAGSGGHALSEFWVNENGAIAIKQALLLLAAEAGLAELVN
ncbi:MAG: M20/M25/M40 family metallo-hydrolase [Gemmatimonadetes bacterium]|nr:M20/M25/M40 family metallo-hydrolase [Gemmatimonadota bacterium]